MKTSELTVAALNWAVALAEGWSQVTATDNDGDHLYLAKGGQYMNPKSYRPSTNWAQGGPIIEREKLHISPEFWTGIGWHWAARVLGPGNLDENYEQRGPTPLIAAMRCYVASKLGDGIEIPKDLT